MNAANMLPLREEFRHALENQHPMPIVRQDMKTYIREKVEQCFTIHDVRAVLRDIVDLL